MGLATVRAFYERPAFPERLRQREDVQAVLLHRLEAGLTQQAGRQTAEAAQNRDVLFAVDCIT